MRAITPFAYSYFSACSDLANKGQWVALEDDEVTVVAHGKAAAKVLAEAAKNGYENPTLFKVPAKALLNIGCV